MSGTRDGSATSGALEARLAAALGAERVSSAPLDRHVRAHDASHYLLIPELVATVDHADAVAAVLRAATAHGVPVTFRSGGTSLSGQASGRGILLDTRRGFRGIDVLDDGRRVRLQPGVTLRAANASLARFRRALGPDPASDVACTVGGVIANNSSGMAAGTEFNSYRTLESLVAVLASGTVVDSADPGAGRLLREREPELVATLERLRDRIRSAPELVAEIRERFSMKNTMGYSLNAFLDFDDPVELLVHLLIGSEGTLGFVADSVFRTVPVDPCVATGLLVFASVDLAVRALPEIVATGAAAIELMDATSLAVARRAGDAPPEIGGFALDGHAALLVEYRGADDGALTGTVAAASARLAGLPLIRPAEFTSDPPRRAALWNVRKGLYAAVAGSRPSGTTALLEDVVVPVAQLARVCTGLTKLIARFGYADGVIFGHAKDGNLHFMVTDDFGSPEALQRLDAFTEALAELILSHGGNLKAEHGTGRAMAPYVPRQYSAALVEVMREVKRAFDPAGVLNPGVVLTEDPDAHLRDLKPVVRVEEEVDRCVECGYCEPACPSRDLTLTPRQRIVARRARALAAAQGDAALVAELDRAYAYDGLQTCAVDGMCQVACPVNINTGELVKRLRATGRGGVEQRVWKSAAAHWAPATRAVATALDAAGAMPSALVSPPNRLLRAIAGSDTIPLHTPDLPRGGRRRSDAQPDAAEPAVAVFLPSCQGAMFAGAGCGSQAAMTALCRAAGIGIRLPDGVDGLCCGTPWASKGFGDGGEVMREHVLDAVFAASDGGALPVVLDAASCSEGVEKIMRAASEAGDPRAVSVIDAVAFVATRILPGLPPLSDDRRLPSLTLHPTCSSVQLRLDPQLRLLAESIAREVHVPLDWSCCGFAGDRGMLHPELTASATRAEAAEVSRIGAAAHASCNRACEIAMTRATGYEYQHLIELVAERHGLVDEG